eukprot:5906065-Amphidinium_carterae.1
MSPYMSPEMISEKGFEYKTDMWSLGVCVYVLFYGQNPYKPRTNTEDRLPRDHQNAKTYGEYVKILQHCVRLFIDESIHNCREATTKTSTLKFLLNHETHKVYANAIAPLLTVRMHAQPKYQRR